MMRTVNAKRFDMVAAWLVDRLGRSLTDLLGILQGLQEKGVDLFLHQQGLDTSTTAGKAMFQMLGVFAEFERGIIRERVNAGLARARQKGTKLGRRKVKPPVEATIRELRAKGDSRLPGRSASVPALSRGSFWRPPNCERWHSSAGASARHPNPVNESLRQMLVEQESRRNTTWIF
jgi:DNA invertase Pin-like site-specific DNA recombinase